MNFKESSRSRGRARQTRETHALPDDRRNSISHSVADRSMRICMKTISISRRKFAQLLSAGAAAALVRPALSVGKPPEHTAASTGVVRLSANENPYGPSPKALKAMTDSFGLACRYPDEHAELLIEALAKLNGVNRDQILLGDGSGEILKISADTFTGPTANGRNGTAGHGKLIVADPTF